MDAQYTFTEDYYEPYTDGSGRKLLYKAGTKVAWSHAYDLGVVTTKRPPADEAKELRVPSKGDK